MTCLSNIKGLNIKNNMNAEWCLLYNNGSTLSETNSSHLKIGQAPKGNDHIPTIHFQGQTRC